MRIGLLFQSNGSLTQRKIINIQMRQTVFTALLIFFSIGVSAQHLRPGFDKEEFMELLRINARFSESAAKAKLIPRSEERRVGRRCICRIAPSQYLKQWFAHLAS